MGHELTGSFFIDQNIMVIVTIGVFLSLGLVLIGYGIYARLHGLPGSSEQLFRIVGFSRLLVTSDTTVSHHANDMLRAIVIGSVQYCELLSLGQLVSLPFYLLSQRLWASHYWQIGNTPYLELLTISLFMPVAMQLLGLVIILGRGRLGGKLSGWPWQTKQIKQSVSEQ